MMQYLYTLLFCLTVINVFGQRPLPNGTSRTNSGFNNNPFPDSIDNTLDSLLPLFEYKYYYLNDFTNVRSYGDTTLDNEFKETDPARKKTFYDLNTGNAGSALLPAKFVYNAKAGFHSGYDQYDLYNLNLDKFKFYDSERTLADLKFGFILGSQNNFIVGADFGQKFKSGISMSLNYNRVSQLGIYRQQQTKTTNFGLAFRLETLHQTLNIFAGIISNTNNEQHNGGIKNLDDIKVAQFKTNIATFLDNANTRYDYKDIFTQIRYNLDGKNSDQSALSIGYHFQYKYGYNRFSDVEVVNDQAFYRSFWIDGRGIRNFIDINALSNEFYLASKLSWTNTKISLVYDKTDVRQAASAYTINDISLKFSGIINVKKTLDVKTNAVLGLGNNAGTFTVEGQTEIDLGKWARLNGGVSFYRSQIPFRNRYLELNDVEIYNRTFSKPFGSEINAGINILPLNLTVNAGQSLINDYLYFDTLGLPVQNQGLFSVNFVSLSQKTKLWKIGFENDFLLQNFSKDIITLPSKIVRSNLYFQSFLFKKSLLLRVGVEGRFLPQFRVPEFNPVLGNYYKGNQVQAEDYLFGDFYILGQISEKFRMLVKWENAQSMFVDKTNYSAYRHPQFGTYIKLGFRWLLLD